MNRWFPQRWIPLYSMVTFNRIPYHEVAERRRRQDKVLLVVNDSKTFQNHSHV